MNAIPLQSGLPLNNKPMRTWSWKDHWHRSPEEAIAELERETHVRIKCFDRWVGEGKMSRVEACDRLERILTAIRLLREGESRVAAVRMEYSQTTRPDDVITDPDTSADPIDATEAFA